MAQGTGLQSPSSESVVHSLFDPATSNCYIPPLRPLVHCRSRSTGGHLGDDLGLRETTPVARDVRMHEYWWMHAGDAAVRLSWRLLWSWRR